MGQANEFELDIMWSGLIGIWEKETDFKFGSSNIAFELMSQNSWDLDRQIKYTYNQRLQYETRNWCTLYSALTELSWLFDKEFTNDEILFIGREAIKAWILNPDKWAFLEAMMNFVTKFWNKNNIEKIQYYQIDYLDNELEDILIHKVVRPTQIWYRTSTELFLELEKNWFALKSEYPIGWGHAVTQWGYNTYDNYAWVKKHNSYSFDKFTELIKNWVIMQYWYVFLKV